MARKLTLETLAPRTSNRGYVGSFARLATGEFVAVGGTYHRPTVMISKTGEAWKELKPPKSSGLRCVLVEEDGALTVVGEYGLHVRSNDRGKTWKKLAAFDTGSCVFALADSPDGERFIVADSGHVYLSSDRGRTVAGTVLPRGPHVFRVVFLPGRKGGHRTVFLASDGALHWWKDGKVKRQKIAEVPLTQLIVLPSGTLLVTADRGTLLRSTDDGKTWAKVALKSKHALEDGCVAFGGVVVVGANGTVLFSKDDGRSFKRLAQRETKGTLWGASVVGERILIGGDEGVILELVER